MSVPKTTKILCADWVLPISAEQIETGAVAVENDKIAAVGTRNEILKNYPDAAVENFGESVIMPGLVNCHSHLELTSMRGFLDDVEADFFKWLIRLSVTRAEKLTDRDIEISAIWGALEGAQAGVTTFGDIGRYGRAGFNALKINGLRGIAFQETDFSPVNENAAEDFEKLEEKFLALRADETSRVKAGISPHSPYTVSRELFRRIADYAHRENVKISVHAAESQMEIDLMTKGTGAMADFYRERAVKWTPPQLSSIKYLDEIGVLHAKPLLAHCIKVNAEDIELIRQSDSSVAHCPKSNAKFGHSIAPFEKFLDGHLRVGFGSDSVASNNVCDILEEARFAALLARTKPDKKRLLSARGIIETATLGGAQAMRLENEIGTLEAGKQADLAVISLENVAQIPVQDVYAAVLFASNARDIRLTMVAGEKIYLNGKSQKIDENALKSEIKAIAQKMIDS